MKNLREMFWRQIVTENCAYTGTAEYKFLQYVFENYSAKEYPQPPKEGEHPDPGLSGVLTKNVQYIELLKKTRPKLLWGPIPNEEVEKWKKELQHEKTL